MRRCPAIIVLAFASAFTNTATAATPAPIHWAVGSREEVCVPLETLSSKFANTSFRLEDLVVALEGKRASPFNHPHIKGAYEIQMTDAANGSYVVMPQSECDRLRKGK